MNRFLCCLIVLVLASMAQAEPARRVAALVGNARYVNEKPLASPHADVALLARTLRQDLQFTEVIERRDLNRQQLFDLVDELRAKAKGADAVVVYFSGHGMRGPGGNYLIPVDAQINAESHLRRDALPASELVDALKDSEARVALLVLDACRDNPYATRTKSGSKGLARMQVTGGNLLVAYATADGQTADDGSASGNSPYAKALAQALRQPGRPLLAQLDAVRRDVLQATDKRQSPTREGDLEVDAMLLPQPAAVTGAIALANPAAATQPCADTQSKDGYWTCRWASLRNPGETCEDGRRRVVQLAQSGNAEAMVWLAQRHQAGDNDDGGQCLTKSDSTSLQWWQRAADAGHHYARCEMARRQLATSVADAARAFGKIGKCMNVSNLGLDFLQAGDHDSARLMALVAVDDGDRQGMNLLAMLYERGLGGLQVDPAKARELYRRSAELENVDGMYNYGIALLVAMGGPADRSQAVAWIEKAASQGHPSAPRALTRIRAESRP